MIDLKKLREIGRVKGIQNLGQMEKDYFQELILLSISRNNEADLIFKGGTCIYKLFSLDRFSEDLDFDGMPDRSFRTRIVSFLGKYGYDSRIATNNDFSGSLSMKILINGPLYPGINESRCRITMDFSDREKIAMEPSLVTFYSLYDDIPPFPIWSMDPKEILAEKIRSVIQRKKARDLYDINFLLKKRVRASLNTVNTKLGLNGESYTEKHFREGISAAKINWDQELKAFVRYLQPADDIESFVLNTVNEMLHN